MVIGLSHNPGDQVCKLLSHILLASSSLPGISVVETIPCPTSAFPRLRITLACTYSLTGDGDGGCDGEYDHDWYGYGVIVVVIMLTVMVVVMMVIMVMVMALQW